MPLLGITIALQAGKSHWPARFLAHLPHPCQFFFFRVQVTGHFKHTIANFTQNTSNPYHFLTICGGARREFSVFRAVQNRACGRKTKSAGLKPFFNNCRHGGDFLSTGLLIIRPPIAHNIGTHSAMGNLRGEINGVGYTFNNVQILWKRFPLPIDTLSERGARYILDTLHQLY